MTTRGRAGETPRSFLWATLLTAPPMMSSGESSRYLHHCQFESNNVTFSEFRALFERYGRVVEADVMTDKNFGFVHVDAGMGEETISENCLIICFQVEGRSTTCCASCTVRS